MSSASARVVKCPTRTRKNRGDAPASGSTI